MKRILTFLLATVACLSAFASDFNYRFRNTPLSEALARISREHPSLNISFIYNDLADFRTSAAVNTDSERDMLYAVIGSNPVRVMHKGDCWFIQPKPAQAFTGKVVDEQGTPLDFVNVILRQKSDSAFVAGCITMPDGSFSLKSTDAAVFLQVSSIGYKTVTRSHADGGNFGTIVMRPEVIELEELEVKSELPRTRLRGNALVTNVAGTYLANLGTANDVIAKLPLVVGANGNFQVFGCGSPAIYINNRRVRDASELEQLSSQNIRSVEVITNPGAQYSADVRAVIRIKTLPPQGEGFSVQLYSSNRLGHFFTNAENLNLKYRTGGLEVFANGYFYCGKRRTLDDSFITTYADQVFDQQISGRADLSSLNFYGKLGFNYQLGETHSFGAYFQAGRSRRRQNSQTSTTATVNGELYQRLDLTEKLHDLDLPDNDANVYYNGSFGNLEIDFNADYVGSKTRDRAVQNELVDGSESRVINSRSTNRHRLWAEKLVLTYPVWKGSLQVGEEYTNSHVSFDARYEGADIQGGDAKIRENNIAAFAELSQAFGPVQIGLGARFEHVRYKYFDAGELNSDLSRNYNNVFPSLALSAEIGKTQWALNFTGHTNRPSYEQLDGTVRYVNRYTYQTGNPALKSTDEYKLQLTGMWRYFFMQASYVHQRNAIFYSARVYDRDPLTRLVYLENVPRYRQMQFVLGAQPTIGCWSPELTVGLIANFYTGEYLGARKRFNQPSVLVQWDNHIALPHSWAIDADFMLHTAGSMENNHVSASSCLNLGVGKSFLNKALTLRLRANDVFNRDHQRITMYYGNVKIGDRNRPESRCLMLTLQYNFNVTRSKYLGTGAGSTEKSRL